MGKITDARVRDFPRVLRSGVSIRPLWGSLSGGAQATPVNLPTTSVGFLHVRMVSVCVEDPLFMCAPKRKRLALGALETAGCTATLYMVLFVAVSQPAPSSRPLWGAWWPNKASYATDAAVDGRAYTLSSPIPYKHSTCL